MNTFLLYVPTIVTIVMAIACIIAIVFYFKYKNEQEFYISLENILSKLGNNEKNKEKIISAIAKALKDAEKDNLGKISHKKTKQISTVVFKIKNDQYELAGRKAMVSNKFFVMLLLTLVHCISSVLVLFGYIPLSFKLFGVEVDFIEKTALMAFSTAATLLVTSVIWPALKIRFTDVYSRIRNKFKK
ncbi:MAG: hypothetical protein E7K78_06140 [Haemophilus haemolyticus]|jgi:hypothetical protein|nr:hypothetical protein [Haemophilus haemolyticus]